MKSHTEGRTEEGKLKEGYVVQNLHSTRCFRIQKVLKFEFPRELCPNTSGSEGGRNLNEAHVAHLAGSGEARDLEGTVTCV